MNDLLQSLHTVSTGSWIGIAVLVVVVLWAWLGHGSQIARFTAETMAELKKCSWPWNPAERGVRRYKELIDSTLVVAISSLLLAGFVTSSDFLLVQVVGFFTRLR